MRYLLIRSTMESKPAGVWLEDAGKLSPYFSSALTTRIEAASAKAFKYKKLEDLIGRNMSYYTTEIGDYKGKKKVEIDAIIDAIGRVNPDTRVASATVEISTCSGFLERGPNGKFSPVGDSEPAKKSLDGLIEVKAPRSPLKMEAYDPDARDGDGDGVVQENTPWERPAATRLMDAAGKLIERGKESSSRPSGMRVVDADGNDVDYTPTYERSRTGTIGAGRQVGESTSKPKKPEPKKPVADKPTQEKPEVKPKKPGSGSALSDHGAGTLKERGMRDVRAAAAPPPPPEPKRPELEKPDAPKPEVPEGRQPARISGTFAEILPKWEAEMPEIIKAQRAHERSKEREVSADSIYENLALREIQKRQGFDGLPEVVPSTEWQDFVDNNPDHIPVFRGLRPSPWGRKPVSELVEQFRSGPYFAGNGIYGAGTYTATDAEDARAYINEEDDPLKEGLIEMVIRPDARIIEWGDARDLHRDPGVRTGSYDLQEITKDAGRTAAMLGYDVILVKDKDTGEGDFYILLNRTAVVVKGAEGK